MIADKLNDFLNVHADINFPVNTSITSKNRLRERCQIGALHDNAVAPATISWFVDRHIATVRRWISRITAGDNLHDQKRSGRPSFFTENIQLKTVAFYCQVSPLPGCDRWTFRWAEKYLKTHEEIIGCSMSYATIQRILSRHSLRPHMQKYFLAITDPDFFPRMDHIINLRLNPPKYLFDYDECTGLQAKAGLSPDLPAEKNIPRLKEFEYTRDGTTDLLAFRNSKTGKIFGRCTPDHKTKTFIGVFKEHVNTLPPKAPLHYIMDNLNTHFHDEFCYTVADLSGVSYTPLKTGAERRSWLQKNKRIVIHFTPFHGSWLNMIEIWFGILSQKCLKVRAFPTVPLLQKVILEFIETWNQFFAHPFTWTYTGQGLHEKAISRFNKILLIESKQMDIKFLTKQLLLMHNIAETYTQKTQTKEWRKLEELFSAKTNFINRIIRNDAKPKQKIKAIQAFNQLHAIMN